MKSARPLVRTLDGLSWTRRALDACRDVNDVVVDDEVRREVHEFVVTLLGRPRPSSSTVFSADELDRIRHAHEGRFAGLFALS